MSIKHKLIF